MNKIVILIFLLLCCCCSFDCRLGKSNNSIESAIDSLEREFEDSIARIPLMTYSDDESRFVESFIGYVEECRKSVKDKNPKYDYAGIFMPQALRYNLDSAEFVASPGPTDSQISVSVDTIVYNEDGTIGVALLVVERHFDNIAGLRNEKHTFNAYAMVGVRSFKRHHFDTYPLPLKSVESVESHAKASEGIRRYYFDEIQTDSMPKFPSSGNQEPVYTLDNPEFFKMQRIFGKDENGVYFCTFYPSEVYGIPYNKPYQFKSQSKYYD